MWKTLACALCALALTVAPAAAQAYLDPGDSLYSYIDAWQGRGLLGSLPSWRPYPHGEILEILQHVRERGTPDDVRIADAYLSQMGSTSVHPTGAGLGVVRDNDYSAALGAGADIAISLLPALSLDGRLVFYLVDSPPDRLYPLAERPPIDLISTAALAVIPVPGADLSFRWTLQTALSYALGPISFQAGLSRASFGPFFSNGIVVGPQAPLAGNLLGSWDLGYAQLTWGFLSLIDIPPNGPPQSNKFMMLQGIRITPWPWLDLGVFESVVWTGRFETLYLIPAFELFYTQSLTGFADNSFLGLHGTARLPGNVAISSVIYADDVEFTDLLNLNFNTKIKVAGQIGASWSPPGSLLRTLSLDYTVVMPYTYTHPGEDRYTHEGANLGPALEPDSQRVEARAFLTPLTDLELTAIARFIQHGNASVGIPGGGNGSIYDDGYVNGDATFQPESSFVLPAGIIYPRLLTWPQVVQSSFQVSLGARYILPESWGQTAFSARYLFEYVLNQNLFEGQVGVHNYLFLGVDYLY